MVYFQVLILPLLFAEWCRDGYELWLQEMHRFKNYAEARGWTFILFGVSKWHNGSGKFLILNQISDAFFHLWMMWMMWSGMGNMFPFPLAYILFEEVVRIQRINNYLGLENWNGHFGSLSFSLLVIKQRLSCGAYLSWFILLISNV